MRACGQGFSGLETFTSLMNLPKPMTANNYNNIVEKLTTAGKDVAKTTMLDASKELRGNVPDDVIVDSIISCDCTWQRRGFSSLNDVVALYLCRLVMCQTLSQ